MEYLKVNVGDCLRVNLGGCLRVNVGGYLDVKVGAYLTVSVRRCLKVLGTGAECTSPPPFGANACTSRSMRGDKGRKKGRRAAGELPRTPLI